MRRILLLTIGLAACADTDGKGDGNHDTDGTEALVGCLVDSTEAVPDTTATPDGFAESVDAMLARVTGVFHGTVTHPDDATEDLTLSVTQDGDPEVQRRSWQSSDDGSGIEPALTGDCPDAVRVPATIGLGVYGQLSENFDADVLVTTDGTGTFSWSVSIHQLHGDARPYGFDPADMAQTDFLVFAETVDADWTGDLSFQGESEPSGDTVSATNDAWGTFTASKADE